MKITKYIIFENSGTCIGTIETNNDEVMKKVDSNPSKFGFGPYNRNSSLVWAKYYKKDIRYKIDTNYETNINNETVKVAGIIVIKAYYCLLDIGSKFKWIRQ